MHLETPVPMNATSIPIPEGDAGTEATIAAMRALIDEGKKDPVVHELAAEILQRARVPAFDWAGEVRAIYQAVRRNVRFTRDIRGKETLHSARETVRLRIGDCDDFTILLCSLLETIGHKTRIVTVAGDGREPDVFTHVFPEVMLHGQWTAVDAARRRPALGLRPSRSYRTRIWDTQSPEFVELEGLAGPSGSAPARLPRAWRGDTPPQYRGLVGVQNGRRRLGAYASSYGAPRGEGRYGARALRGLGVDWGAITGAITAGTTGAANIITASRATPYNLFPTTAVAQPAMPAVSPYGVSVGPEGGTIFGLSPTTLLLGGGLLLVAVMVARR